MATSSLCKFLSFLAPSPQPAPQTKNLPNQFAPPSHSTNSLPILSSSTSLHTHRNENGLSPLVAKEDFYPSSSRDLMSVMSPSLANANTLFHKSDNFNVMIVAEEEETVEELIRRFRREVIRARIIQETKRRRHFETNQEKRKRKIKEAARRNKRSRSPYKPYDMGQPEDTMSKKVDEEPDNWEIPSGGLPF